MLEDDLKTLTEAVKENTAVLSKIAALLAAPRTGKNADCLIIDEPALVPVQAPATVAKPAVLITPAPAPVAPAPVAPAPVAPAPVAPAPVAPAPAPAPSPAPAPAPVAPAPAPAPADPIPTNYKEAKTLGLRMAAEGHSDVLKEFLASCGVKKLIDLPHERYGDYYKWFKDKGLL